MNDQTIKKLAKKCIQENLSYSKVARENGVGIGRIKKFIDALRTQTNVSFTKEKTQEGFNTIEIFFDDGEKIELNFSKSIVRVKKQGDLI